MSRRDFPAEVLGKVEKLRGSMEKLNGASGVSDMHGNAARAAESDAGAERMKADNGKLK